MRFWDYKDRNRILADPAHLCGRKEPMYVWVSQYGRRAGKPAIVAKRFPVLCRTGNGFEIVLETGEVEAVPAYLCGNSRKSAKLAGFASVREASRTNGVLGIMGPQDAQALGILAESL